MKRVFLSSVVASLEKAREAACAAIDGLDGYHCIRMESFGARPTSPINLCMDLLRTCDVYVAIVGHLHGSCPPGSTKSYTELEYEEAKRLNMPRFVFLATEDFPIPAILVESDERRARQRDFRSLLSTELVRASFQSDGELRAKVAEALANHDYEDQGTTERTVLLFPYVTNQVGFDTGIAISNTGATRFRRNFSSGICQLYYYGRTASSAGEHGDFGPAHFQAAAITPITQTSDEINPGDQLLLVLSKGGNLGLTATPSFQGYIIAECRFPHARGFAFITDGEVGKARLSASYLAEVIVA